MRVSQRVQRAVGVILLLIAIVRATGSAAMLPPSAPSATSGMRGQGGQPIGNGSNSSSSGVVIRLPANRDADGGVAEAGSSSRADMIATNDVLVDIDTETAGPCPMGFFGCNGTVECVEQRRNCDGHQDCADGSDEWDCADLIDSTFWDHLFRKRPAARSDDLEINECVWVDLNNTCACRSDELHCQHRNLLSLPPDLPDDGISLLDLTGNQFPTLDRHFFDTLPPAEIIVLKHCSIRELKSKTFARLERIAVHTIYLDQNRVEVLPKFLFPPQNRVNVLILAGNKITRIHEKAFANLNSLIELDLRDNRIVTFQRSIFQPLLSLQILYLNGNRIARMPSLMLPRLPQLRTLSLSDNQIAHIDRDALMLPHLEHLFLSGNRIAAIRNNTFVNLPMLLGLNLNDNRLGAFEVAAFHGIDNLTSLLLEGNAFQRMDVSVLAHLTRLQYVYFSSFHLCKAAMHVRVCEPRGDGISSTEHLLDNLVLRVSVWIMALVGVVFNLLVLGGRVLHQAKRGQGSPQAEHSLYLRHLAASDLIMSVYLGVIAVVDIAYRGEYLQHDETWRHSVLCSCCGFLSTLSCQSSTFLLTMITWDRLVSVTRPLQVRSSNRIRAILRLTLLWSVSGMAAGSPLSSTAYFGDHFYGSNGVCLSLHIHDPYAQGWEYSAAMFILVNSASLGFIIVSYARMMLAIRGSGEAMRSTLSGREGTVARRFGFILISNCACWVPVISVKVAALSGAQISPDVYAYLAVLILPINSALNPVLYTLTTAAFKQQLSKMRNAIPCVWMCRDGGRHNGGYESAALSFSAPQSSFVNHQHQQQQQQQQQHQQQQQQQTPHSIQPQHHQQQHPLLQRRPTLCTLTSSYRLPKSEQLRQATTCTTLV